MICFRDKTFCDSDCENSGCHRHFGPQESDAARSWWDGEEPNSFGCMAYAPVLTNDEGPNGLAYIRIKSDQYEVVGHAAIEAV